MCKVLISHKADLNAMDNTGVTPLMLAIARRDKALVDEILSGKPNLEVNEKHP